MPYVKKYRQRSTREFNLVTTETRLPLDKPIANYYRQSSEGQIGNISTTMQTVNMAAYLERLGWNKDHIIMIDMDAGVSGMTKIDEREGMRLLFTLITQKKIGAVACQDEDRLFRDVTQIQVNIFIEACKSNDVLVITPSMVYDFAHPSYGSFHARQFRFKSEMAADYIETVVRGKLYAARKSLFLEGRWAGSSVPTGYMIDMRKRLSDGSKNENWRRYEIFEPYACVIREYFNIFLLYSGNITKTLFHIREKGPYYPDSAVCKPPEDYKVLYRIRRNKYGLCPATKGTLANMFGNALYIGHFIFGEAVVRWNNHPPIIDEDTFFKAFNYLSDTDLEGNENVNFKPIRRSARPSKEAKRPEAYPLLSGLIFSEWESEWRAVGTCWHHQWLTYYYCFYYYDGFTQPQWRKKADFVDKAVTSLMLDKLKLTFDFKKWDTVTESLDTNFINDKRLRESQLAQLKVVQENLLVSLTSLSSPQMIVAVEKKYLDAQAEYERICAELELIKSKEAYAERIQEIKKSFSGVLEKWGSMTADEKRQLCHIFINRIEAIKTGDSTIGIKIYWKDKSDDYLHINKITSKGTRWLPQEITRLVEIVESGASKLDIAKEFPDRKWKDIYYKYKITVKKGVGGYWYEGTIKKNETYNDYIKRGGKTNKGRKKGQSLRNSGNSSPKIL